MDRLAETIPPPRRGSTSVPRRTLTRADRRRLREVTIRRRQETRLVTEADAESVPADDPVRLAEVLAVVVSEVLGRSEGRP